MNGGIISTRKAAEQNFPEMMDDVTSDGNLQSIHYSLCTETWPLPVFSGHQIILLHFIGYSCGCEECKHNIGTKHI